MGLREKTTTGNHDEGTKDHQTTLPFPPLDSSLRTAKVHQQWGAHNRLALGTQSYLMGKVGCFLSPKWPTWA